MKVDKKFLACPRDFYDHVKACGIENEELERIICGENSLDSGFFEICYAFARCAEEQSTYTPEQQLNAIDKLRELIAVFCRKNSYTADSALFEIVNRFYVELVDSSETSLKWRSNADCGALWSGGMLGVLLVPPTVGDDIIHGVWKEVLF